MNLPKCPKCGSPPAAGCAGHSRLGQRRQPRLVHLQPAAAFSLLSRPPRHGPHGRLHLAASRVPLNSSRSGNNRAAQCRLGVLKTGANLAGIKILFAPVPLGPAAMYLIADSGFFQRPPPAITPAVYQFGLLLPTRSQRLNRLKACCL